MDLTKKYLLRLPDENVTLTKDELVARVKEILKDHPSEHMNAYRVWYEGFEGCGMPGTDVYDVIVETMRALTDDWKDIGPRRWEKYGVVNPSFFNLHSGSAVEHLSPIVSMNFEMSISWYTEYMGMISDSFTCSKISLKRLPLYH